MTIPGNFFRNKWLRNSLLVLFIGFFLVLFFGSRILYANSLFQAWVQRQIAEDTKGTFQFKDIQGGFISAELTELSLDLKGTPFNVQKVQAPEMWASFAWIPLLQNHLVIRSLTMKGGRLDIRMVGGSPEHTALPVSASFRLKQGTVSVANFSGWALEMSGCDLEVSQSGSGPGLVIEGSVSAAHAKLGGLDLEDVQSDFRLEGGKFHVQNLRATLPGKSKLKCSGFYVLDGKPSLEVDMAVNSPNIKSLLQAVDFSNRFGGKAEVALKAQGIFTPSLRSLKGDGNATFSQIDPDISLPKLPAYNDAPILKRIRDIDDLEGQADFQLNGGKILAQKIDLKNKEVHITGTAQIGYDRSLSSNFVFNGDKTVAAEIPAIARNAFSHDPQGHVIIPFQLEPTTHDPQVDVGNIVNRVISEQIKGFNPLNILK